MDQLANLFQRQWTTYSQLHHNRWWTSDYGEVENRLLHWRCNIICDKYFLSSDQLHFFEIANAVKTEIVPEMFDSRSPGRLNHARWLTIANRSKYLLKHHRKNLYSWLHSLWIRMRSLGSTSRKFQCLDADPHYYKMIETSRFLPVRQWIVVENVLQRNSYPAHIESIFLDILNDNRQPTRRLAWRRILRAREEDIPNHKFETPAIQFQATSYEELIDWQTMPYLEIILTKHISTAQIKAWILSSTDVDVDIQPFPCHNQAVECVIKIVTESSSEVYDHDKRDCYIRVLLNRRKLMPRLDTKSEFQNI